jgi:hypothetical protein
VSNWITVLQQGDTGFLNHLFPFWQLFLDFTQAETTAKRTAALSHKPINFGSHGKITQNILELAFIHSDSLYLPSR